ncbi:DUF1178 family protein [Magnetovibrio blakemorei]|uniref:Uncharacterized protein n=1 Tax=Magnetovibrio blakemorei TaxID=28181 RepID=A0A1E5Q6T4_9PROT|nr:DUF1178 family protein [Magnetovibrio blakemorei]OEJ66729.1 hypothetical protein BEN30_11675 [Magnetovibrio blakemorei]
MILYQLRCADEHSFEAWFRNSTSYDEQTVAGDVECPYCGSTNVSKAPMAPHLATSRGDGGDQEASAQKAEDSAREVSAQPVSDVNVMDERRAQEVAQQILDAVGQIHDYAEEHFENVGDEFASEARKMHYGDTEERGIYGKTSEEDAEELKEEGIDFLRIPGQSRRNN